MDPASGTQPVHAVRRWTTVCTNGFDFWPMKTNHTPLRSFLVLLALSAVLPARAVYFTNDTIIGPDQIFFDGDDLALSNCTVTVDGPHSFATVHVLAGGVLTHSFSTNGL